MKLVMLVLMILSFSINACSRAKSLTTTDANAITYRITFKGNFTKVNHPVRNFPSNPHFSPMVVANHSTGYSMFPLGTLATTGVKNVAETGNSSRLTSELGKHAHVKNQARTSSSVPGTGVLTTTIQVSKSHPLISVISMIAPSPDWFVGITLSVLKGDEFIERREIPLYAMDSGTDEGLTFTASDAPNDDPEFIHLLVDISGIPIGNPFGTLTIEKL